ncbi:MAG: Flagellar biosynthesis protein FlhA [Phycisphaerae bacterium]|nr:Flagellar biosynthesis protein FlhA [Phycisphaerae bacterium]
MSTALELSPIARFVTRHRGLLFPAAIVALLFVILIPLPTFVLDFLLIANILLSTVVMMTVIYIRTALEFSSFPSLLLSLTLLRLVLNIATTRLIISNGESGTAAAGHVVQAFGVFVAAGSLAVGVIIFVIITVIQFVVITKGATRIAEVAARFTLDGMPGKQMAIDADLNAGIINEAEARRRREEISAEADFYGAMDGASKFVRGDAIAGLVITFVNVLGGLYVGMVEDGMTLWESLDVFTKLTIGDGLASQIPAFILSVAAGLLVTRNAGKSNLGEELLGQVFAKPVALGLTSGFLGVLALTPLPTFPLLTLAAGCSGMALMMNRNQTARAAKKAADERAHEKSKPEKIEAHLKVDALELQLGFGLVRLVDRTRGGDLLDRIAALRRQTALEHGLVIPPVRIRDSGTLPPNSYAVLIRGQDVARGEIYPDQFLAINSGVAEEPLAGIETVEPAFGLRAYWVAGEERTRAERHNYTVIDASGVLITHLTEVIRRNAAELLTRGETQKLIDALKERNAALVDEVIPAQLKVGDVQKVLQNLLRERVPIRDLEVVLEALGDWAPRSKDPEILSEYARNALARTICAQYRDEKNVIHCITLDPAVEDYLQAGIQRSEHGSVLSMPPDRQAALAMKTRHLVERAAPQAGGATLAVVCSPVVRMWFRRLIEPMLPQTPVLALNEIVRSVELQAHGVVTLDG